jgi:hypothetical protein
VSGTSLTVIESDRPAWANRIRLAVGKSVEAILEVGRLLLAAKEQIPHGEFMEMVQLDLPFSIQTADKFMAVASNHLLTDPAHVRNLPPSWGHLYELSRIPGERLAKALRDGEIRPDMQRAQIQLLLPPAGQKGPIERRTQDCRQDGCNGLLKQFRSVPAGDDYLKIFEFRIYECQECGWIYETAEVIHRQGAKGTTKRYVSRVETVRQQEASRVRRAKVDNLGEEEQVEEDGNGPENVA